MRNLDDKIFSFLAKVISRRVIYATCVSARRVAIGNYIEKPTVGLIYNHMQVTPPGGQIYNRCKWGHLMPKFVTDACGLCSSLIAAKRLQTSYTHCSVGLIFASARGMEC